MSEKFDYLKGMKRKVGWFVLLGLGVLVFMLLITGARSNFFAKKFYVYVQPPTATSFYEGLPVRFQGFGIGYVDLVELLDKGEVKVTLQLLDRYRPMLHQGAVVQLAKEGLIGEQFVRISAGEENAPILENKVTVAYESEVSVEQLLEDLKPSVEKVDKLLGELVTLAAWTNDPDGTFHSTMANLQDFSAELRGTEMQNMSKNITRVVSDLQKVISEMQREHLMTNLSHALDSTAVSLDEVKPFLHDLGQSGGQSLEKMDGLLERMQVLADNLNVVSSDASELTPELPGLARELREGVSESRLLMRTIRHSWLFGDGNDANTEQKLGNMNAPPAVNLRP